MGMEILGIIPARGGSKGVPDKNIRILAGKPLICWTIEYALASRFITRLIVTTDSKKILEESRVCGAETPFLRPDYLARDETPSNDALIHALEFLKEKESYIPDFFVELQPTSPLRKTEHIDGALEILVSNNYDSVVSVVKTEEHPAWMKTIDTEGRLKPYISGPDNYHRRQDLPEVFSLNGAIYAANTGIFLREKDYYTNNTVPYVMDRISSIDIDSVFDFRIAEMLMEENEYR